MIERGRTTPETEREKKVLHPAKRGSTCAAAAVGIGGCADAIGVHNATKASEAVIAAARRIPETTGRISGNPSAPAYSRTPAGAAREPHSAGESGSTGRLASSPAFD
jgi:hypothetical protein